MNVNHKYPDLNPEVKDCLKALVTQLARLVAKEELEKMKSLNNREGKQ